MIGNALLVPALSQHHAQQQSAGFLILDRIAPLAIGAFSAWEKLRAGYLGRAFRLRRSSDDDELDIGFRFDGLVDVEAILSFVGSSSAYVTAWYDQSGNGRDLSQSTHGAQPRIVNAGAFDTLGASTKQALKFDGADDALVRTDALGLTGNPNITIAVAAQLGQVGTKACWSLGGTVISHDIFGLFSIGADIYTDFGNALNWFTTTPSSSAHSWVQRHAAGANVDTADLRVDGAALTRAGGNSSGGLSIANTHMTIGGRNDGAAGLFKDMSVGAWVAFGAVLSGTDLAAVEAELDAHRT